VELVLLFGCLGRTGSFSYGAEVKDVFSFESVLSWGVCRDVSDVDMWVPWIRSLGHPCERCRLHRFMSLPMVYNQVARYTHRCWWMGRL